MTTATEYLALLGSITITYWTSGPIGSLLQIFLQSNPWRNFVQIRACQEGTEWRVYIVKSGEVTFTSWILLTIKVMGNINRLKFHIRNIIQMCDSVIFNDTNIEWEWGQTRLRKLSELFIQLWSMNLCRWRPIRWRPIHNWCTQKMSGTCVEWQGVSDVEWEGEKGPLDEDAVNQEGTEEESKKSAGNCG